MEIKQGGRFAFAETTSHIGLADADALPVGVLIRNGADDGAVAVTVTRLGLGRYALTGTVPTSYFVGDFCQVFMAATVNGIAGGRVVPESAFTVALGNPYVPAVPSSTAEAVSTDANGFLTLYVSVPGAGDAVTLTDGNGTVVYQGAGLGVATTLSVPLDPGALPGGPDSPGQVVAWTWGVKGAGVPDGVYAGTADCTGQRALAVTVQGTMPSYELGPPNFGSGGTVAVVGSTGRVLVSVSATDLRTGDAYNPTADSIRLAFTAGSDPEESDWADAAWVTTPDGTTDAALGVSALAPGDYCVFVQTAGFVGLAGILSLL